ncbi:hypothetical protein ABD76_22650 [Paenibacillus dendritiformis]|nr:hypothetical protein [Paenibacillus dendritiformis]
MVYNKSKLIAERIARMAAADTSNYSASDPAHRRSPRHAGHATAACGIDGMDEPESEAIQI